MNISLPNDIKAFWNRLTSIGADSAGDFVEQKRIRIIDIIAFLCLPIIFIFAAIAFSYGHFYLTGFYFIISVLIASLIYGNYKGKDESFRIVIIFLITISCAVANVLFDNGQGYYILLISFLSVLFYGMRKGILYLSLFYAALYIGTEICKLYIDTIEPVAAFIKVFRVLNVLITLSILVYFLYDIKKSYLRTLDEAINKKKNLEEYNALLVKQAVSLELKNKDIEELKNKNEELSSIVYHQLRSPVVTFADLLSQYIESSSFSKDEFIEISKLTQRKVTDTLNIIDNLLMWNRKGIDGIQPSASMFEMNSILDKAVVQVEQSLERKDLKIVYPKRKNLLAFADANHTLIIMLNILTNAIKFSPPGEEIKVEFTELPGRSRVHISNYGRIERKHLQDMFSSLHLYSGKGTFNETGTGLGLKICKNLVEKNNGSIDINSDPNDITTIMIELPSSVDTLQA
jgi:two-component system sensor histidine kinase/response regulator